MMQRKPSTPITGRGRWIDDALSVIELVEHICCFLSPTLRLGKALSVVSVY
jgi:hypothetical protein